VDQSVVAVDLLLVLVVAVRDRERARDAAVRRADDRAVALGLLGREPVRDDERAALEPVDEADERRVGRGRADGGVERPLQHVVEVDRAGELAEQPVTARVGLGALERAAELADRRLHAHVEVADGGRDPLVGAELGTSGRPSGGDEGHEHADGEDRRAGDGQLDAGHAGAPCCRRTII
jgi:hypothetical protein